MIRRECHINGIVQSENWLQIQNGPVNQHIRQSLYILVHTYLQSLDIWVQVQVDRRIPSNQTPIFCKDFESRKDLVNTGNGARGSYFDSAVVIES